MPPYQGAGPQQYGIGPTTGVATSYPQSQFDVPAPALTIVNTP